MFYSKLVTLASKMNKRATSKQYKTLLALLKEAAASTYYRAIPIRASKGAETYQDKVESAKQQAIDAIAKIFETGVIDTRKNYAQNAGLFNITRHWEVAVYYATYQTERRLVTDEPLLPLIVAGTVDDKNLMLDVDELKDRSLTWPTLEQWESKTFDDEWLSFLMRNYGEQTAETIIALYVDQLREGVDPIKAREHAIESHFRHNPDAARSATHSVDPNFKDQYHISVENTTTLPVENAFLIQRDGSAIELTPQNYIQAINEWEPATTEELRETKKHQDFSGVEEGFYPFSTR